MSRALAAGVARFLPNPEEFWGPKPRAGRHLSSKHIASHGAEFVNGTLRAEGRPPIEETNDSAEEGNEVKRQKLNDWFQACWREWEAIVLFLFHRNWYYVPSFIFSDALRRMVCAP